MTTHYEASMQRDISFIRQKVSEMAGLAQVALKRSLDALLNHNRQEAYSVILRDQRIDELEKEIDRLCLEFIVRQQPVAGPLRFAYVTIKINQELERIGDYSESIARQVLKLSQMEYKFPKERYVEIATLSIAMLADAVKAFLTQDAELASRTMETEETVDQLRNAINKEILLLREANLVPMESFSPLTTIARRFERVSDQAKNICEEVLYMVTGEYMKHRGVDVYRILFVDQHNSCRSQMAEAIANGLGHAKLVFNSAGLEPRPLHPATIQFLQSKGLDISRQQPKQISQVPNLEYYTVAVALAKDAKKLFNAVPAKAVKLDWLVEDPSETQGTPEEIQAAFERTYAYLEAQIKDLADAILGSGDK
jgi:phosphate transport system protein